MDNLVLNVTLANTYNYDFRPEEIYEFIEKDQNIIQSYQFAPKGPAKAAIDYVLVLGVLGSVASVASLLWNAYNKYIGSKKSKKNDSAGIYINLDINAGTKLVFWIGKDYVDKDVFISVFSKKIAKFRKTKRARDVYEETMIRIVNSGDWIRRK